MLNRTEYGDGRPAKITYHDTPAEALIEALRDCTDPALLRSTQERIDYQSPCICGSAWKFFACCLPKIREAQKAAESRRRLANDLLAAELMRVAPPVHASRVRGGNGRK
jgi:hypothetical protein